MKSKSGTLTTGSVKFNPKINDIKNKIEPPIPDFKAVTNIIFCLRLKNLLRLVSRLQKNDAETTKMLPNKLWLNVIFCRLLVLRKIAPSSKNANPKISFL